MEDKNQTESNKTEDKYRYARTSCIASAPPIPTTTNSEDDYEPPILTIPKLDPSISLDGLKIIIPKDAEIEIGPCPYEPRYISDDLKRSSSTSKPRRSIEDYQRRYAEFCKAGQKFSCIVDDEEADDLSFETRYPNYMGDDFKCYIKYGQPKKDTTPIEEKFAAQALFKDSEWCPEFDEEVQYEYPPWSVESGDAQSEVTYSDATNEKVSWDAPSAKDSWETAYKESSWEAQFQHPSWSLPPRQPACEKPSQKYCFPIPPRDKTAHKRAQARAQAEAQYLANMYSQQQYCNMPSQQPSGNISFQRPYCNIPPQQSTENISYQEPYWDAPSQQSSGNMPYQQPYWNAPYQQLSGNMSSQHPYWNAPSQQSFGNMSSQQQYWNVSPQQPSGNIQFQQPSGNISSQQPSGNLRSQQPSGNILFQQPSGNIPSQQPSEYISSQQASWRIPTEHPTWNASVEQLAYNTPVSNEQFNQPTTSAYPQQQKFTYPSRNERRLLRKAIQKMPWNPYSLSFYKRMWEYHEMGNTHSYLETPAEASAWSDAESLRICNDHIRPYNQPDIVKENKGQVDILSRQLYYKEKPQPLPKNIPEKYKPLRERCRGRYAQGSEMMSRFRLCAIGLTKRLIDELHFLYSPDHLNILLADYLTADFVLAELLKDVEFFTPNENSKFTTFKEYKMANTLFNVVSEFKEDMKIYDLQPESQEQEDIRPRIQRRKKIKSEEKLHVFFNPHVTEWSSSSDEENVIYFTSSYGDWEEEYIGPKPEGWNYIKSVKEIGKPLAVFDTLSPVNPSGVLEPIWIQSNVDLEETRITPLSKKYELHIYIDDDDDYPLFFEVLIEKEISYNEHMERLRLLEIQREEKKLRQETEDLHPSSTSTELSGESLEKGVVSEVTSSSEEVKCVISSKDVQSSEGGLQVLTVAQRQKRVLDLVKKGYAQSDPALNSNDRMKRAGSLTIQRRRQHMYRSSPEIEQPMEEEQIRIIQPVAEFNPKNFPSLASPRSRKVEKSSIAEKPVESKSQTSSKEDSETYANKLKKPVSAPVIKESRSTSLPSFEISYARTTHHVKTYYKSRPRYIKHQERIYWRSNMKQQFGEDNETYKTEKRTVSENLIRRPSETIVEKHEKTEVTILKVASEPSKDTSQPPPKTRPESPHKKPFQSHSIETPEPTLKRQSQLSSKKVPEPPFKKSSEPFPKKSFEPFPKKSLESFPRKSFEPFPRKPSEPFPKKPFEPSPKKTLETSEVKPQLPPINSPPIEREVESETVVTEAEKQSQLSSEKVPEPSSKKSSEPSPKKTLETSPEIKPQLSAKNSPPVERKVKSETVVTEVKKKSQPSSKKVPEPSSKKSSEPSTKKTLETSPKLESQPSPENSPPIEKKARSETAVTEAKQAEGKKKSSKNKKPKRAATEPSVAIEPQPSTSQSNKGQQVAKKKKVEKVDKTAKIVKTAKTDTGAKPKKTAKADTPPKLKKKKSKKKKAKAGRTPKSDKDSKTTKDAKNDEAPNASTPQRMSILATVLSYTPPDFGCNVA